MKCKLKSEDGNALIEFAFVLPVLLLVVLGIVDFGFLFQRMQVMTNAAREGARMAMLPGYRDENDEYKTVKTRVREFVRTGGVPITEENPEIDVIPDVDIPTPTGPAMKGTRVQVKYWHEFVFIKPIAHLFRGSFDKVPVSGVAIMRNEVQ